MADKLLAENNSSDCGAVRSSLRNQVAAPDILFSTPFRDPLSIVCEECLREPRLTECCPAALYGFLSATTKRSQSFPANCGRVEILIWNP